MKQLNSGNRRHYYRNASRMQQNQQPAQAPQPPPPPPPPPQPLNGRHMQQMEPAMVVPSNGMLMSEAEVSVDLLPVGAPVNAANSSLFVPNPGKNRRLRQRDHRVENGASALEANQIRVGLL